MSRPEGENVRSATHKDEKSDMHETIRELDEVTRRELMRQTARSLLGVGVLSPFLASGAASAASSSSASKAKNVIYLFMSGGMSHLDTFDPKPGAETQGPTEAIKTKADGIRISQHLPKLAKHMDKASLVRSLHTKTGSHGGGQYFMRTSYTQRSTIRHPGMGAWSLKLGPPYESSMPGNVLVGGTSNHPGAGFMDAGYSPVRIGNPYKGLSNSKLPEGVSQSQFQRRLQLMERFNGKFSRRYPHEKVKAYTGFYDDAVRLMRSRDLQAFDISSENKQIREAYGMNRFGQGVLLARRLVEHGVRFVEVDYGGWDTHSDNFDAMPGRCGPLDQALSTLFEDLESKGMLQETLIVVATEFGRTPHINDRNGRDHYPRVFSGMLAGGGIKHGQVYGRTDAKGIAAEENQVNVPDFNATIAKAIGLPVEKEVYSQSGRPFTVADEGKPIDELLA